MASSFIQFLGSVRLAIPLLGTITAILIAATFYESSVGSSTVQQLVYKSPWFGALMFLLAVNLGLSTLSRYPWRGARKIGFALTHWGLIVIIAGSAAVIHLSTEGMLLVRTDREPGHQIRIEGDLLEVVTPTQARQQVDLWVQPDGTVRPAQVAGLTLLGYSDNVVQTTRFTDGATVENVAVQLRLSSERMGQTLERWLAVAPAAYRHVDMGPAQLEIVPAHSSAELEQFLSDPASSTSPSETFPSASTTADFFRVVVAPSGQLFYTAQSSQGFQSGVLQPGVAISPGWADFQISLVEALDHAQVQRHGVPVTPVNSMARQGTPALHVATADGQEAWLPWGDPTALETAEGTYLAAFRPKLLQLPFWVKLDDFIVERNEGSDSVAMWTSQLTLIDPHGNTAVQRAVWMNHPTWFKGWKLAQASWNPGDLQQSTLQLKREPWWVTALTWSGSLLVVGGIAVMFYGPAVVKGRRRRSAAVQPQPGSMHNPDPNLKQPQSEADTELVQAG